MINDFTYSSFDTPFHSSNLEYRLNNNFPLEKYLNDEEAISCARRMGPKAKRYFNSERIKQLVKFIIEEPESDEPLRGHKYPYVANEILRSDCPFILNRFLLNKEEYYNQYKQFLNEEETGTEKEYENQNEIIEYEYNYQNEEKVDINKDEENKSKDKDDKGNILILDDDNANIKKNDDIIIIDNKEYNKVKINVDEIEMNERKNDNNNINDSIKESNKDYGINCAKSNENFNNKDRKEELAIKEKDNIIKQEEIEKTDDNQKKLNEKIESNIEAKETLNNIQEEKNKTEEINIAEEINKTELGIKTENSGDIKISDLVDSVSLEEKYESSPNNEHLDLLLSFVMNDKLTLNYVLSGYFSNVIMALLNKSPSKLLNYLYDIRPDVLEKIVFRSYQRVFSALSGNLLNLEKYGLSDNSKFINFRNEIIGKFIKSLKLDEEMESQISLILTIMNNNENVVNFILENNEIYGYIFNILNTNLYDEININNNFDNRYIQYYNFVLLLIGLLKEISKLKTFQYPKEFYPNCIKKEKSKLTFNEYTIICFGNILKYNFLPKNYKQIKESGNNTPKNCLGLLSIKILDLVKEMFTFMKEIPNKLDTLLINNDFCQRSMEYFFDYPWNNIYHMNFIQLFYLYLKEENNHKELTKFIFQKYKFNEILLDFLKSGNEKQKLYYQFKTGKKIKSGVYVQVVHLIYKLQVLGGLDTFNEEEKEKLKIKNLGEFEFLKDQNSINTINRVNISSNIGMILKQTKDWDETVNNTIIPLIRQYEGKLGELKVDKKEDKKEDKNENKKEDKKEDRKEDKKKDNVEKIIESKQEYKKGHRKDHIRKDKRVKKYISNPLDILLMSINNSKRNFVLDERTINSILSSEFNPSQRSRDDDNDNDNNSKSDDLSEKEKNNKKTENTSGQNNTNNNEIKKEDEKLNNNMDIEKNQKLEQNKEEAKPKVEADLQTTELKPEENKTDTNSN